MFLLEGDVKPYAWGSRTAIAELCGRPSPASGPEAELWIGAHPLSRCRVHLPDGPREVASWIEEKSAQVLGERVASRFGGRLPFLVKVLAADEPLSIQAHPSLDQAREGFSREEAAGVPIDAPHRSYKDDNHKPELLCALTRFEALSGFRAAAEAAALVAELEIEALDGLVRRLGGGGRGAVAAALEGVLSLGKAALPEIVASVGEAASRAAERGGPHAKAFGWAADLARRYPGDPGVVCSLLLEHVELAPGEAIFLPAGNLHAYLRGVGIEVMASSDNVLRGGLTPKHVDVAELLRVLDFDAAPSRPFTARRFAGESLYETPAPDFRLSRVQLDGPSFEARTSGPEILLCVEGSVLARTRGGTDLVLGRGASAFVPAATAYELLGTGLVFRCAVPG